MKTRRLVKIAMSLLLVIIVMPIISLNVEKLVERAGWDTLLIDTQVGDNMLNTLEAIMKMSWFFPLFWFTLGGTIVAWILPEKICVPAFLKLKHTTFSKNGIVINEPYKYWLTLSSKGANIINHNGTVIIDESKWRVGQFNLEGINTNNTKIKHIKGYIESNNTNNKFDIKVDNHIENGSATFIPPNSKFTIKAIFPRSTPDREGWIFSDFWKELGSFTLNIEFDKTKISRVFTKEEIEKWFSACLHNYSKPGW